MAESNVAPLGDKTEKESLAFGLYLVGIVRGIVNREVVKKETGEVFQIAELAVERDNFDVQRWALTKGQREAGWELALEKLKDRKCLIPVSVQKNGNFVNYRLRGNALPKPMKSDG